MKTTVGKLKQLINEAARSDEAVWQSLSYCDEGDGYTIEVYDHSNRGRTTTYRCECIRNDAVGAYGDDYEEYVNSAWNKMLGPGGERHRPMDFFRWARKWQLPEFEGPVYKVSWEEYPEDVTHDDNEESPEPVVQEEEMTAEELMQMVGEYSDRALYPGI